MVFLKHLPTYLCLTSVIFATCHQHVHEHHFVTTHVQKVSGPGVRTTKDQPQAVAVFIFNVV